MTWSNFIEAVLMGSALAMDALAASVALGAANRRRFYWTRIALTAGTFGFFQFFMPLIGFYASSFAEKVVNQYGSWITGLLLIGIGSKMFFDGRDERVRAFSFKQLFILALATSIDALLVGVSYRCMQRGSVWWDVIVIGIVTMLISAAGCIVGRWSGKLLGKHCAVLGALVLIMLGIKVIIWS